MNSQMTLEQVKQLPASTGEHHKRLDRCFALVAEIRAKLSAERAIEAGYRAENLNRTPVIEKRITV